MDIGKVSRRAKQIRKAHPGMKWATALKQAGSELKGGSRKKSAPRKKAATRKRSAIPKSVRQPSFSDSVSSYRSRLKGALEDQLGKKFIAKERAKGKRNKKRIQKEINATRSELRKLKG